ncbi:phosphopantetheine-binding protein [Lichenibacterium dinghuense]|uniref:phosphopantetheine-binding protein n=1 Tax=Lichenibacterium dinghuense TaxID=2895977 RepID=UPI001F1CAA76|nr:phosphopantetheine-binding protein [Lichenibacterium sp. 6Y81]
MLDNVTPSPAHRIGALVTEILARRGHRDALPADAELARLGLTSIDMVEVMLGVESEFDLAIPPRDITLDNFRSVNAIAGLVGRIAHAA